MYVASGVGRGVGRGVGLSGGHCVGLSVGPGVGLEEGREFTMPMQMVSWLSSSPGHHDKRKQLSIISGGSAFLLFCICPSLLAMLRDCESFQFSKVSPLFSEIGARGNIESCHNYVLNYEALGQSSCGKADCGPRL